MALYPPIAPRAGWRWVDGHRYCQVRAGSGARLSIPLSGVAAKSDAEATARARLIVHLVHELALLRRAEWAKPLADAIGRAKTAAELAEARASFEHALEEAKKPPAMTVRQFAERWTSGELARLYPDQVSVIDHGDNIARFEKYIFPILGRRAIAELSLEDGDRVMARLPRTLENRRAVAQCLYRLARLAVYPGRVLARSPFPPGWLPHIPPDKAKPFLYPDEDARLLACTAIPLRRRIAYGLLDREGFRPGEVVGRPGKRGGEPRPPLPWSAFDLAHGVVNLDKNKTDDPRTWPLKPGTAGALRAWQAYNGSTAGGQEAYVVGPILHLAERLRDDLRIAGVTRPELWERSGERARLRAHDLRGTFVTLSLANGKTEAWVTDRTGHKSSAMIYKYKRAARTAEELGLGPLLPLDEAIPEFHMR